MERAEEGWSLNIVPPMFRAGISSNFTKRYQTNFRDTTLTAASAAKERAVRELERQTDAIEKQQQKIDIEMERTVRMTLKLHRQQLREANCLRNRLNCAAFTLQRAYRRHLRYLYQQKVVAAELIQAVSRRFLARLLCCRLCLKRENDIQNHSSVVILRSIRRFTARNVRAKKLKLQRWAVCSIQSIIRMAAARSYVQAQRQRQTEASFHYRAAVIIQRNARAFMTRLIYLDVLYLICRIQAAMRGCLVRDRLRWILAADVDAISILQAHIRGFLARKKMAYEQGNTRQYAQPSSRLNNNFALSARAKVLALKRPGGRACFNSIASDRKLKNSRLSALARIRWQPKRSYWLPAGASFNGRLPVLPVPKRLMALAQVTAGNGLLGYDFRLLNQSWTQPKRSPQKSCSVRSSPMILPSGSGESSVRSMEHQNASGFEKEERLRRHEKIKRKLCDHRMAEKRRHVHEVKLQREVEHEATERRLMEREEKIIRLQHKVLRRRSREGKIRQVTLDQRREKRERLTMAREERRQRLHVKFCVRQLLKRRQQLVVAPTTISESETQPLSTASSRYEITVCSTAHSRQKKKTCDDCSNDDGNSSFLAINLTIPSSMKQHTHLNVTKKSSKLVHLKKRPIRETNKESTTITSCLLKSIAVKMAAEEDEYSDDFEDIIDEAALTA